jgi:hypothetical protein
MGTQIRKITAREEAGRYFVLLASIALFSIFYREWIAGGFDKIPGDDGDALLNLHILEHWYRWLLRGEGAWLSLSSFFPLANTLGYTDSMFLLAVPFGLVRSLQLDLVTAYQFTLLFVHIVGYVAFYHLLRSVLLLRRIPALLGACLGTLNNAFYVSIGHTQLFTMGLIPVALLLLAAFLRTAKGPSRTRWLAGSGLAILLPLMLYTGYYVTWFLVFAGALAAIILLLADRLLGSGAVIVEIARWLRSHKLETLTYLLLALVALTPFLLTYLPILREIGGRPFEQVRATLPNWFDFFNVGTANTLWGSLFIRAFPQSLSRPLSWELAKGAAPFTLLLFLFAVVSSIRSLFSPRADWSRQKPTLSVVAAVVGTTVIFGWLLELRVGDHSSWWLAYQVFPGARAIRAVFRFQHVLLFGVSAVIAIAFHEAWEKLGTFPRRSKARSQRILLVMGAALLLVEQLNSGEFYLGSKSALLAELGNVGAPPYECRAFFVLPPPQHNRPSYGLNTNAMLMAYRAGIPTLNGYTSGPPPNWGLSDVYTPDYISRVVAWLNLHQIHNGICSLSLETWKWGAFDISSAPQPVQLEEALPDGGYQVHIEMLDPPKTMRVGEQRVVSVRVDNRGTATLSGLGRYAVRLSYQWTDANGKSEGFNYRKDLPRSLKPGESIVMSAELQVPTNPGLYRLEIDLVQELIAWFRNKGGLPYSTQISIVDH